MNDPIMMIQIPLWIILLFLLAIGVIVDPSHEPILPQYFFYKGKAYKITYRSDAFDIDAEARKPQNAYLKRVLQEQINAEPWVVERFVDAVKAMSFIIIQILGMSRSGKSELGLELDLRITDLWELFWDIMGRPHFADGWSNALDLIEERDPEDPKSPLVKRGDVIHVDEEPKGLGRERKQDKDRMENVLKATRARGVSFVFCDPDPEPKPNVDMHLQILGIIEELWATICIVRSPAGNVVGLWLVFLEQSLRKDILREIYQPFKDKTVAHTWDQAGLVGRSDMSVRQEQIAVDLLEYMERKYPKQRVTKKDLETHIIDLKGMANATDRYRSEVVQRAWKMHKKHLASKRSTAHDKDTGIKWVVDMYREEDLPDDLKAELRPFLIAEMQIHNDRVEAKGSGQHIKEIWIDCFLKWIESPNVPQSEVAMWYTQKVGPNPETGEAWSQALIGKWVRAVRNSILGYAVEEWIYSNHPEWNHVGGNTPDPDFWTDDQVISVKARCRQNVQIEIKDFGKAERKLALDTGRALIMLHYELKYSNKLSYWLASPKTLDERALSLSDLEETEA